MLLWNICDERQPPEAATCCDPVLWLADSEIASLGQENGYKPGAPVAGISVLLTSPGETSTDNTQ